MSAPNTPDVGCFGLSGARVVIKPGTPPDEVAFDALILVNQALAVFESISDNSGGDEPLHELHFAGLYLLRQASIVLNAVQMTPQQGMALRLVR